MDPEPVPGMPIANWENSPNMGHQYTRTHALTPRGQFNITDLPTCRFMDSGRKLEKLELMYSDKPYF